MDEEIYDTATTNIKGTIQLWSVPSAARLLRRWRFLIELKAAAEQRTQITNPFDDNDNGNDVRTFNFSFLYRKFVNLCLFSQVTYRLGLVM